MKRFSYLLLVLMLCSCSHKHQFELRSPDKDLQLHIIHLKQGGSLPLELKLSRQDRHLVSSRLGLEVEEWPPDANFDVVDVEVDARNDVWTRTWGRSKEVRNHYNALSILLETDDGQQMKVEFRAFNGGMAYRYHLPAREGLDRISLRAEGSTFSFPGDPEVWATTYGGRISHQENEFVQMKLSHMGAAHLPLLIKAGEADWLGLSEAQLVDWAGFHLEPDTSAEGTLQVVLEPRFDQPELAVVLDGEASSPWRVLMVENSPGKFLENDLIQNLNAPCALDSTAWIQPGKSAWDWWWSNSYAPEAGFPLGSNTETMKYFIDFAAEMGWEYQLVDWQWYGQPFAPTDEFANAPNPEVNITRSTDQIDIPALVRYADSKGVKLLLWLEWNHADRQMDEAFPLYEKWGVAGVKVDFMAREDQEMVQFYERLVKLAAKHHLVVDFHGAYKPTGLSRTWPNLMTREGVLGNEYTKWSDRITPEHTVTLAFTRNILGEMDFTPGAWLNVSPDQFRTEAEGMPPVVMSTRCNQLAMMVVFESALQVVCDSPHNYRRSPAGLDFLQLVPTTWDQTQVLNEEIGNFIVVARRAGDAWFLGAMTDGDARDLDISLNFLEEGAYTARVWKDGTEVKQDPTQISLEELEVHAESVLKASLAAGGGLVAHITKN